MDLSRLDRRIIFLLMTLAIAVPMLFNVTLPVKVEKDTLAVYDRIERLQQDEYVMVSFDFEASSFPEMRPLAVVILNHLFERDIRVIGLALFSEGTALGFTTISDVAEKHGKKYGVDYIYLGFRPQYISAILGMGESIARVFPEDYIKKQWQKNPFFSGLENYDNAGMVISISDGSMPIHWAEYANARYGVEIGVACAAVMVTAFKPYFNSGQLTGPVAGVKGAAEYEKLLGSQGAAQRRLFTQSSAHILIIVLVLGANLAAFFGRKK